MLVGIARVSVGHRTASTGAGRRRSPTRRQPTSRVDLTGATVCLPSRTINSQRSPRRVRRGRDWLSVPRDTLSAGPATFVAHGVAMRALATVPERPRRVARDQAGVVPGGSTQTSIEFDRRRHCARSDEHVHFELGGTVEVWALGHSVGRASSSTTTGRGSRSRDIVAAGAHGPRLVRAVHGHARRAPAPKRMTSRFATADGTALAHDDYNRRVRQTYVRTGETTQGRTRARARRSHRRAERAVPARGHADRRSWVIDILNTGARRHRRRRASLPTAMGIASSRSAGSAVRRGPRRSNWSPPMKMPSSEKSTWSRSVTVTLVAGRPSIVGAIERGRVRVLRRASRRERPSPRRRRAADVRRAAPTRRRRWRPRSPPRRPSRQLAPHRDRAPQVETEPPRNITAIAEPEHPQRDRARSPDRAHHRLR